MHRQKGTTTERYYRVDLPIETAHCGEGSQLPSITITVATGAGSSDPSVSARAYMEQCSFVENWIYIGEYKPREISEVRRMENQGQYDNFIRGKAGGKTVIDFFSQRLKDSEAKLVVAKKEFEDARALLHKHWKWKDPLSKANEKLKAYYDALNVVLADTSALSDITTAMQSAESIRKRAGADISGEGPASKKARTDAAPVVVRDDRMADFGDTKYANIDRLSAKYETRGDASTISSGKNDPGGKSYGKHQLSSKRGAVQAFLEQYQNEHEESFAGLAVGSDAFDAKWKEMSKQEEFVKAQDHFVFKKYFKPVRKIADTVQILDTEAINMVLYSLGVNHGASGASEIVGHAAETLKSIGKLDDQEATVICLYNCRKEYIEKIPESSQMTKETKDTLIKQRCVNEKADALQVVHEKDPKLVASAPKSSDTLTAGFFQGKKDRKDSADEPSSLLLKVQGEQVRLDHP